MRVHVIAVAIALATWTPALSAEAGAKNPQPKTLEAWGTYVAATEARMESELFTTGAFFVSDLTGDGGVLRDAVIKGDSPVGPMSTAGGDGGGCQCREPRSRTGGVRCWSPGSRSTRCCTGCTYDTEHLATYRRLGLTRAASRSVSTKIVEVGNAGTTAERIFAEGEDRGFLWRMNSYWRYEEVPGGVIVELESITLGRRYPRRVGRGPGGDDRSHRARVCDTDAGQRSSPLLRRWADQRRVANVLAIECILAYCFL